MTKKLNEMTREEALLVLEKSGLLAPATKEESPQALKETKGRRSNGEGSWTSNKRKNGTYWKYTIYLGKDSEGKVKTKSFGSYKKSEAIKKANEYRKTYFKGKTDSSITLEDYFADWVTNFKANEVSPRTLMTYCKLYELRLKDTPLGRSKLENIDLGILQEHFNNLSKSTSPSLLRVTKSRLNACFNKAVIEGLIPINLCSGIKLKRLSRTKEIKALSKEEQKKFIEALNLNSPYHQVFFLILYSGLRRGEVLGLTWEDFKDGALRINKQLAFSPVSTEIGRGSTYSAEIRNTKTTGSVRVVPLPQKAIDLLNSIPRVSKFIFINRQGNLLSPNLTSRTCATLLTKLGMKGKGIHSLRHTYATRLFQLGESPKVIQTLLGHKDIRTTLDIYTHVMPDQKKGAVDKLNDL